MPVLKRVAESGLMKKDRMLSMVPMRSLEQVLIVTIEVFMNPEAHFNMYDS